MGERRPADFTADLYTDVYKEHMDFLKIVVAKNPEGYEAMLHWIFHLALYAPYQVLMSNQH